MTFKTFLNRVIKSLKQDMEDGMMDETPEGIKSLEQSIKKLRQCENADQVEGIIYDVYGDWESVAGFYRGTMLMK